MVCYSFCTFRKVVICFWTGFKRLLEFVNAEKFFSFAANNVFRCRCIVCVFAVHIELSFGSDANSERFPVVGAAPISLSRLEPSV